MSAKSVENRGGGNPFQFGFIGSSDTHSAASQNYEKNFVSKLVHDIISRNLNTDTEENIRLSIH